MSCFFLYGCNLYWLNKNEKCWHLWSQFQVTQIVYAFIIEFFFYVQFKGIVHPKIKMDTLKLFHTFIILLDIKYILTNVVNLTISGRHWLPSHGENTIEVSVDQKLFYKIFCSEKRNPYRFGATRVWGNGDALLFWQLPLKARVNVQVWQIYIFVGQRWSPVLV